MTSDKVTPSPPAPAEWADPSRRRITRRGLLLGAAGTALLAACGSSTSAKTTAVKTTAGKTAGTGGTLNIYSWPSYFSPGNLAGFNTTNHTKVNISTYTSNDAMFAKLTASSGGGFDMAIPTSGWVPVMAEKGLLAKLDHSRLNLQHVSKTLLGKAFDPQNTYSVPKDYGVSGVCYNSKILPSGIKTWQDFLDAGTRKGVSGHIDLGSGSEEILGVALFASGKDWNTDNLTYIQEAGATMKAFAKHVKEFNGFDVTGLANGTIVMAYCDQSVARQAMVQNKDLRFSIPLPTAELWVDNYTILSSAADAAQAYSFIDWQLDPAHQLTDTQTIGYPTALPNILSELPATFPLKDVLAPDAATIDRLTTFVVRPKVQQVMEQLYNEISSGSA